MNCKRFEQIRIYFSDVRSSAGVRQARCEFSQTELPGVLYSGCTPAIPVLRKIFLSGNQSEVNVQSH